MNKPKLFRTSILVCLIFLGIYAESLSLGLEINTGNLSFSKERTASALTFDGTNYPLDLSIKATESVQDQLNLQVGFYSDPILKNLISTIFEYQENIFTFTIGPFVGILNGSSTIMNPGLTMGFRAQLPGLLFAEYRTDSTIGGQISTIGDYMQSLTRLAIGIFPPNAITTLSLETKTFTQKNSATTDIIDNIDTYKLNNFIYQKNVTDTVEISFGYEILSRKYIEQATVTHSLGSILLGVTIDVRITEFSRLRTSLDSSIYSFGRDALIGITNPGPGGYMFKINTGITFDIDQLTTTSMF